MDASYNAVKAYRDFEAANYADDTYQSTANEYNDDDLLKAALGYYGGMNFKKYNDIKKMSQAEVLAAKADVVALAEAIVAFEGKFEKKVMQNLTSMEKEKHMTLLENLATSKLLVTMH